MTAKAAPAASHTDAAVGLMPRPDIPDAMFGVVKRTYDLRDGSLTDAEPLTEPWWDKPAETTFAPGNDYVLSKSATDVTVLGDAFLKTDGRPGGVRGEVRVRLGDRTVRCCVWGPRIARWHHGTPPRFEAPEAVERVPMTWTLAYGGGDPRVPYPPPQNIAEELTLRADHPGVYPRNPGGRGYVVLDEAVDAIALPQIEAPDDLLTPARMVTGAPSLWYQQPRPAGLGLRFPNMYPRRLFVGVDAWFPAPETRDLCEVRRGELPLHFRTDHGLHAHEDFEGVDLRFLQEAPPELQLHGAPPGFPIEVHGMHPEARALRFGLPAPPQVSFWLEGLETRMTLQPHLIVIRPEDERMTVTWTGLVASMHRTFIPGVHPEIPLSMTIDNALTVAYPTPPPIPVFAP